MALNYSDNHMPDSKIPYEPIGLTYARPIKVYDVEKQKLIHRFPTIKQAAIFLQISESTITFKTISVNMTKVQRICPVCDNVFSKYIGHVNRSEKNGLKLYCNRICAGIGRRTSLQDKREIKRIYDLKRRDTHAVYLKKSHAEYHKRTYDPIKAAEERKIKMPKHIEYCRQPEYRKWKKVYDKKYTAKKNYGEFSDAAIILCEIEILLESKQIKYDQGLINKTKKRKQKWKNLQRAI
jgi:hypothetical protein